MKIQIELQPELVNLLMEIGNLENRDPEIILQEGINSFVHDRLLEEAGDCELEQSHLWLAKADKLFNSW